MRTLEKIEEAVSHLQSMIIERPKEQLRYPEQRKSLPYNHQRYENLLRKDEDAGDQWQKTRSPSDESRYNLLSKKTKEPITKINNKMFKNFQNSLTPMEKSGYSLWKVSKVKKKPSSYTR